MLSSKQTRRAQNLLILSGLVLAVYYIVAFRPLSRRAASFDAPLGEAWQKLAAAQISSNPEHELHIERLEKNLKDVQGAVRTLDTAGIAVESSVQVDPAVREKMKEPFQLVDFQIEELLRIEELGRAAQQNNVAIAPVVFANFPEFRADRTDSELLWGQLAFLHQLLSTAIRCNVTSIQSIELPPHLTHARTTNAPDVLFEIPLQVEVIGPMDAISRLLVALPEKGRRTNSPALPEVGATKPALFIDRILLRKNSPERPDETHLELRVCGFIYRNK